MVDSRTRYITASTECLPFTRTDNNPGEFGVIPLLPQIQIKHTETCVRRTLSLGPNKSSMTGFKEFSFFGRFRIFCLIESFS